MGCPAIHDKIKPTYMKYLVLAFLFITFSGNAFSQRKKTYIKIKKPASTEFPASFVGHWKGTLEWFPAGAKEPRKVVMHLRVYPRRDSSGQYTWNMIYGDQSKDNHPYLLKPIDTTQGHWVIDEVNGIVVDQYWTGGKFCSAYTVQQVTLANNYWIEKGDLVAEFISYNTKPISKTGMGTEDVPYVYSYEIRSYQKAVLKKQ
jgi:hypothetical protein